MSAFLERHPFLFHVTRASAVAGITRLGILPASTLAGADIARANRAEWTACVRPDGGPAILRWQRLGDRVLWSRLPNGTSPTDWRRLINAMVFLFGTLDDARRLAASREDRGIEQVVIRFATADLLGSGCALHTCRWNNGYPDRCRPPRIRTAADYRPMAAWRRGDPVREITVKGPIPPTVPFTVLPPAT